MTKNPRDVIRKPVVSETSYALLDSDAVVFTRDSLDAFCGRSVADKPADEELVLEEGDRGSGGSSVAPGREKP